MTDWIPKDEADRQIVSDVRRGLAWTVSAAFVSGSSISAIGYMDTWNEVYFFTGIAVLGALGALRFGREYFAAPLQNYLTNPNQYMQENHGKSIISK